VKRWQKLLTIIFLGLTISLGWNKILHAQILPAQLVQQAQELYQAGKFSQSINRLKRAEIVYQNQKKYLQQVQVLSLTSLSQQHLGQWQAAQKNLENGFDLLESVSDSRAKAQVLAQIWNVSGHYQYGKGNSRKALEDWQQGEKLYRQLNDTLGINGSLLDQAQALEKMGFYRRSCNYVLEALNHPDYDCENLTPPQLNDVVKSESSEALSWQIAGLSSLSNSLLLMGKLSYAQIVLEAVESIQVRVPSPTQGKILLSLGNVHKAIALRDKERGNQPGFTGNTSKAISYYQEIVDYSSSAQVDTYKLSAQLNHLSLLILTKKWSEAQKLVDQINLTENNPNQVDLLVQIKLARNLDLLKEKDVTLKYSWQDIAELYSQVAQQAQNQNNQRIKSYALGYLGKLHWQHHLDLDQTPTQLLEEALNLAQASRSPEISYRWQWWLGKIYHEQKQRAKAISFYDAALKSLGNLRNDIAALTKEVQFGFKEQIEPVYREFADLLLETEFSSNNEIKKALNVIESLQVAELDNYFQDACTTFEPKNIAQIDQDAAVIYTIVLPDRLEVILAMEKGQSASEEEFHRNTIPVSQQQLAETIKQLQEYLTEPDQTLNIKTLSAQIYDWLIKPLESDLDLKKPQTLVFVLDNILQNIPMSTLYDGQKYLIENYAIALTPGLRLINPAVSAKEPTFLAGGVSKALQVSQQNFSALNNVEEELNIFAELDNQILLNTDFTSKNLSKQLDLTGASSIHIATHGQFSSNPEQTFLLLWQQLLSIREFGDLLFRREQVISNPLELLVLSACDTATGDSRAALGLAGIAVRSGAATTVATLWHVNDESTTKLMRNFYQELAKNKTKAEALRQAQLQLWQTQDKDWQVPAFWSPYVIIGNWN